MDFEVSPLPAKLSPKDTELISAISKVAVSSKPKISGSDDAVLKTTLYTSSSSVV